MNVYSNTEVRSGNHSCCEKQLVLHIKLDRQRTCKVTLRSFSRNCFCSAKAISITYFCVCVCDREREWVRGCERGCPVAGVCLRACSLTYPACNAHVLYCHLQALWLHLIFRHYLVNGKIFGKTLLKIKRVFLFSLQILFEIFCILRRIQQDVVINIKTCFMQVFLEGF